MQRPTSIVRGSINTDTTGERLHLLIVHVNSLRILFIKLGYICACTRLVVLFTSRATHLMFFSISNTAADCAGY